MSVTISHKDKGLKRILKNMRTMGRSHTIVGFPANGDMAEDGEMTVAGQATLNEYGTVDIPSRPFIRMTNSDESVRKNMGKLKAKLQHKLDTGTMSPRRALALIGEIYVGDIKKTIMTGQFTKNTESTLSQKRGDKPLIDSRHMLRSVKHEEIIR